MSFAKQNPRFVFKLDRMEELWKILDTESDQSHDGDGAVEWVASAHTQEYAQLMTFLLNTWTSKEKL